MDHRSRNPAPDLRSPAPGPVEVQRSRTYVPELDGVRALCVLGVITAHLGDQEVWHWLSGGLGVNVFFVLSGYLITMLALREERETGSVSLRAFYVRRTMRIFPLYYLALVVYCGLMYATHWGRDLRPNFTAALPYYLTYLQEIPFAYDVVAAGRKSPFSHSWSLGIEEKYYLVWPVLAFVVWARLPGLRLRGTLVLLVLYTAMQSVGRLDPRIAAWQPEIILFPYSLILWGCLLAQLLEDDEWRRRLSVLGTRAGTALAVLAFAAAQLAYAWLNPAFREIVIAHAAATTAVVAALLTGDGPIQGLLRTRPAVFVGRVSYGMYLFHGLGISAGQKLIPAGSGNVGRSILAFVLSALVTVAIAYVLAVLVERPFLRLGRRWSDAILRRRPPASPPSHAATGAGVNYGQVGS
jgi:peptidoglycan/LPS O-acetylase OafA/YrhL